MKLMRPIFRYIHTLLSFFIEILWVGNDTIFAVICGRDLEAFPGDVAIAQQRLEGRDQVLHRNQQIPCLGFVVELARGDVGPDDVWAYRIQCYLFFRQIFAERADEADDGAGESLVIPCWIESKCCGLLFSGSVYRKRWNEVETTYGSHSRDFG